MAKHVTVRLTCEEFADLYMALAIVNYLKDDKALSKLLRKLSKYLEKCSEEE